MAGIGGARPGAGRPKGIKNPATIEREQYTNALIGEFHGTAIEFMAEIIKNPGFPMTMRAEAAKNLAPYQAAKLSNITVSERKQVESEDAKQIAKQRSTEELQEIVRLHAVRPVRKPKKAAPELVDD